MIKKLAIIGGGVTAGDFIDACDRIGYEAHYFSMADGKTANSDKAIFHEINIFDKDGIVEICKNCGIDGVVATTELTVPITAYVAEKLGAPGNLPAVANVITDKRRNRDCTVGLQLLKSPKYAEVSSIAELKEASLQYPIILKPVNLGGKRGLTVVRSEAELETAFAYATNCFRSGVTPRIIAEEFIECGVECSVESITINGAHNIIQITEKVSGGAPHCVELGHHQPAALSQDVWNKVVAAVSEGLTAIGLTTGACHTEIKVVNDEVYLIEFNARPGGDCIAHPLTMLSTGFDYLGGLAKVACSDLTQIDTESFQHKCAGLLYVVEQTKHLKPEFDSCESKDWCYRKNFISDSLEILTKNNLEHTNYFIYTSTHRMFDAQR